MKRKQRKRKVTRCYICGEPIGIGLHFYNRDKTRFWHWTCATPAQKL